MTHIDADTYGNPQVGLTQTQTQQFIRGAGDVGRGLYRDYNRTGPLPVSLEYIWSGAQMVKFRDQWEDEAQLCFGSNWFSIDLPLMQSFRYEADRGLFPHSVTADQIFSVTVGTNAGQTAFGARNQIIGTNVTPWGELKPTQLLGYDVGNIYFGSTNLLIKTGKDNVELPLPDPNETDLEVHFVEMDETGVLVWNGADYSAAWRTSFPLTAADWIASVGETRTVSMRPLVQPFQRYVSHFTAPYSASLLGVDHWRVNLSLEVDPSETLKWLAPDG